MVEAELRDPALPAPTRILPKVQRVILDKATCDEKTDRVGSTLSASAQHAGISPKTLKKILDEAEFDRNHPMYEFAKDFRKKMAEREDFLTRKMFEHADEKGRFEAYRSALERQHDDWKERPGSEKQPSSLTVIEKLAVVNNNWNKALPTGD
jgi:hypothetical protein